MENQTEQNIVDGIKFALTAIGHTVTESQDRTCLTVDSVPVYLELGSDGGDPTITIYCPRFYYVTRLYRFATKVYNITLIATYISENVKIER